MKNNIKRLNIRVLSGTEILRIKCKVGEKPESPPPCIYCEKINEIVRIMDAPGYDSFICSHCNQRNALLRFGDNLDELVICKSEDVHFMA